MNTPTEGLLVIISGPSGAGKGTVVKRLDPGKGYALSVSVTTRAPRGGELDGRDYFFLNEQEFARMRRDNELLESARYVNHFYGTPRKYVEQMVGQGKAVVLEIEVNGALQVKEQFPGAVLIFLMPPSVTELSRRLQERKTEDADAIDGRLKRAMDEVAQIERYHYLVINDDVDLAVARIDTIVAAERMKPSRSAWAIDYFINN